MKTPGQNLLALLVGRPATKAAQLTAGQYLAAAERRQARGREDLSNQWVYRQGAGSVSRDVLRDRALLLRQDRKRQQGWMQQNAELLKQYPQLQRHASYFAQNPRAWQKFQADAGLTPVSPTAPTPQTPATVPKQTPATAPAAQQSIQTQPIRQTPASSPAPAKPQPQTQTPPTDGSPQDPVRQQVEAARAAGPKIGLTYAEYQERLRKMRTPAWRQPQVPGPTAEPPKAPGFQVHPPQLSGAAVTLKPPVVATRMPEPQLKPLLNRTTAPQTSAATSVTPKAPSAPAAQATAAAKPPPPSAVAGTPLLNQKFTAFGGSNSGIFAGTPTAAKPTSPLPAAKPTVATWAPGQNLLGMTRAQTQAYQGKLPKIAEVLVRSLTKRAQAYDAVRNAGIVTDQVEPNKWQASVDAMVADQERQREEAMKPAPAPAPQLTPEESWDRYAAKMPIVQKKDTATTMREHEGYKSWGDRLVSGQMAREEGTSTGAILRNGFKDFAEDWAHDTLNNWNIYANNIQRGAGDVGRFVAKWVDPRSWGSSTKAKLNRQSHDNDWQNAQAASMEKDRRILDSMNTGLGTREFMGGKGTSMGENFLARLNYGLMAGTGQFAGGDLATAGIGGTAKGISKGITGVVGAAGKGAGKYVTRGAEYLGRTGVMKTVAKVTDPIAEKARYVRSGFFGRARNLEAARNARIADVTARGYAPTAEMATPHAWRRAYAKGVRDSSYAERDMWSRYAGHATPGTLPQRIGGSVSRGIAEVGNTIAAPFSIAGNAATPVTTISKNPVTQAALKPVVSTLRGIAHPVQSAKTIYGAGRFAMQHPVQAAGRIAAAPFQYGYSVAKPAIGQAWKGFWSMPTARAYAMQDAYENVRTGNYGQAAADIGTMGAWGMGAVPGAVATVGRAMAGSGEDDYQDE